MDIHPYVAYFNDSAFQVFLNKLLDECRQLIVRFNVASKQLASISVLVNDPKTYISAGIISNRNANSTRLEQWNAMQLLNQIALTPEQHQELQQMQTAFANKSLQAAKDLQATAWLATLNKK